MVYALSVKGLRQSLILFYGRSWLLVEKYLPYQICMTMTITVPHSSGGVRSLVGPR